MLNDLSGKSILNVNCDIACMFKDQGNLIDQYDAINLNCAIYLASSVVNAKLHKKEANIRCETTIITDYDGEVVRIEGDVISNGMDYSGLYVIASGDLLLKNDGIHAFKNVAGAVVSGTLYYPESCSPALLAQVKGAKRAYPDDAYLVLKKKELSCILTAMPENLNHIWVAGELSAFEEATLQEVKRRGIHITCDNLMINEGLYRTYRDLFYSSEKTLIPDGYTITGPITLNAATAALYGEKLYVRGALLLEEKDAPCLEQFQSIIVKGRASLPVTCVKAFKTIGNADSYRIYEGVLYSINGFEMISHERLKAMVEQGNKMTLSVNGCVVFSEDVTADDMEAISQLNCNGMAVMPGEARSALNARIGSVNGSIADSNMIQQMAGCTLQELIQKFTSDKSSGNISTDVYLLN